MTARVMPYVSVHAFMFYSCVHTRSACDLLVIHAGLIQASLQTKKIIENILASYMSIWPDGIVDETHCSSLCISFLGAARDSARESRDVCEEKNRRIFSTLFPRRKFYTRSTSRGLSHHDKQEFIFNTFIMKLSRKVVYVAYKIISCTHIFSYLTQVT